MPLEDALATRQQREVTNIDATSPEGTDDLDEMVANDQRQDKRAVQPASQLARDARLPDAEGPVDPDDHDDPATADSPTTGSRHMISASSRLSV